MGTARRQGAKNIYQVEILLRPPEERPADNPWPEWPRTMRTSSSHEEGCERIWSATVTSLEGPGAVKTARLSEVEWMNENGRRTFVPKPGGEFDLDVELVLLAMGFLHVEHGSLISALGIGTDGYGNIVMRRLPR